MVSYTDTLKIAEQVTGTNNNTWGDVANLNFVVIDQAVNGYLSISVAGSSNVTLTWPSGTATANQANNPILKFTGLLTGNIKVFWPATSRRMQVQNATTGAFSLTAAITGEPGTSVEVPQGTTMLLWTDGTDVVSALADTGPIGVTDGMTVAGGLGVAGGINADALSVSGAATVSGNTSLVGTLSVGGAATLGGAATVTGAAAFSSTANIAGAATIGGAVTVGGAATVTGLLSASPGGAANQAVVWSQFGATTTAGGASFAIPQGALLQGGTGTTSTAGAVAITFPTEFDTKCWTVIVCLSGPATDSYSISVNGTPSTTGFNAYGTLSGVGTSGIGFNWFAIGN